MPCRIRIRTPILRIPCSSSHHQKLHRAASRVIAYKRPALERSDLFLDDTSAGHPATQSTPPSQKIRLVGQMTTMASDSGSSSSSEPSDEPFCRASDEFNTTSSSSSDNGSGDANSQSRDTSPDQEPPTAVTMTARAYQLEMLEESLKKNIIVAVCWSFSYRTQAISLIPFSDGHREREDAGVSGTPVCRSEPC